MGEQLVRKVTIEQDSGTAQQLEEGNAGGDLVREDHVGREAAQQHQVQRGVDHSRKDKENRLQGRKLCGDILINFKSGDPGKSAVYT